MKWQGRRQSVNVIDIRGSRKVDLSYDDQEVFDQFYPGIMIKLDGTIESGDGTKSPETLGGGDVWIKFQVPPAEETSFIGSLIFGPTLSSSQRMTLMTILAELVSQSGEVALESRSDDLLEMGNSIILNLRG